MTRHRNINAGNAALETVLFTPLALLFLFVGVDAGFALVERATIQDAIRSSLNSEILYQQRKGISVLGENEINFDELELLLESLGAQITKHLAAAQNYRENENPGTFKVKLAGVLLEVDENTGQIQRFETLKPLIEKPEGPLSLTTTNLNALSINEFIENELQTNGLSYALPLSPIYSAGATTLNFLPNSLAIYLEVSAQARGINPLITKSILGQFYVVQEQHLTLLRKQLS